MSQPGADDSELLLPPVSSVAVSTWASISILLAGLAGPIVLQVLHGASHGNLEGMVVVAPVFVSWWFSGPAVVGGATCLGFSSRVGSARARSIAYTLSAIALGLSVLMIAGSLLALLGIGF